MLKGHLKTGQVFYYVEYASKKTGIETALPILAPVLKIYNSNNHRFPFPQSSQTINYNIKKVALFAQIDDEIVLKIKRNNTIPTTSTNKWQHVSCHTGRRSFITNFARRIPEPVLSRITHPHQMNRIIDIYNKIGHVDNIKLLFEHIYANEELAWLVDYPS